jgi:BlaI family penicillinase repressor
MEQQQTPSETEWQVMEIVWASNESLTSQEIIKEMEQGDKSLSPKTIRVLINRLCQKQILDYTVDERDSRIYHYFAVKTKEECLKAKSRHFADSYFAGNQAHALATLITGAHLTDAQMKELIKLLNI